MGETVTGNTRTSHFAAETGRGPLGRGKVVWDTGDAVIGQIGATNWDLNGYILEAPYDYLPEITIGHRRTTTGDSERLVATFIIAAWTKQGWILLLGTENSNVMAWATNGYAKRGSALLINRSTARWIALRGLRVGSLYMGSGRNFSPDRMTRTAKEDVIEWATQCGITKVRLGPLWGELMANYRDNVRKEIEMPRTRRVVQTVGKLCVDRNGTGGGVMVADVVFGGEVRYLIAMHNREENTFRDMRGSTPFTGWGIFLLGGSARTEKSVRGFQRAVQRLSSQRAVLVSHLGIDMIMVKWCAYGVVDSTMHGDVMGSLWQIGVIGTAEIQMPHWEYFKPYAQTLGDRYRAFGVMPSGDERGVIANRSLKHCVGMEVIASIPHS